jgi:hypothetical protein
LSLFALKLVRNRKIRWENLFVVCTWALKNSKNSGPVWQSVYTDTEYRKKTQCNSMLPDQIFILLIFKRWLKMVKTTKMIKPTFNFEILKKQFEVMDEQAGILINIFKNEAKTGNNIELLNYLQNCTHYIICRNYILVCKLYHILHGIFKENQFNVIFSHQTHALGSLSSASTAVQKYNISRLLTNSDMLYFLTGACNQHD